MRFAGRAALAALMLATAGASFGQGPAWSASSASSASSPVASVLRVRPAMIMANDPACSPVYPTAAIRAGAQGVTVVQFAVAADGRILSVAIAQRSGETPAHALLDQAAVVGLSRCKFRPGTDAFGRPAGTVVRVSYTWKLE